MRAAGCCRSPILKAVVGILGVAALLMGCSDDDPGRPKDEDEGPDLSTPQLLLASFREAYVARDYEAYEQLLAEDFVFYFAEEDIIISESLSRAEDLTCHQNMFTSTDVSSITLAWTPGDLSVDSTMADPLRPGEFLSTIIVPNVDLALSALRSGWQITYIVEGAREQFWFRATESGGETTWSIACWRELGELTPDLDTTEPASWGSIKNLFR